MNKINFNDEHKSNLEKLYVALSFSGETLANKFGAGTITPYDALHNTSVATLKSVHSNLKSEVAKKEQDTDEWTNSEYDQRQLSMKKKWMEFIHLMIGYKRSEEEKARNSKEVRELKKELEKLKQDNMSPEDKIKAVEAKIAEMEGTAPAATTTTPA
jgi:chromosome segregation ATPase